MTLFKPQLSGLATLLAFTITFLTFSTLPTQAATRIIADGDTAGLINAIVTANGDPYEDTIVLAGNGRYPVAGAFPDAYFPMTGLPGVKSPIVIEGNGAVLLRSSLSERYRFFTIDPGAALTLYNLRLEGGHADRGGAIFNKGLLTMVNCVLTGNQADGEGGALFDYNLASATLSGCTLSGNRSLTANGGAVAARESILTVSGSTFDGNAGHYGGALYFRTRSSILIDRSTFTGNQAEYDGGGIYNYSSSELTMINSTLSGNTAGGVGGAIATANMAETQLSACSLIDNQAATGLALAVYMNDAYLGMTGTLIANREALAEACHVDVGTLEGFGINLATDVNCAGEYVGYDYLRLGPLAVNGGPTRTHALLPGSVAIDYIAPADAASLPETDQRGVPRPIDADANGNVFYDAGAFEHEPIMPIDIQPKDVHNVVLLTDKHFDVLVPASTGFDPSTLTSAEMVGTTILFGTAGDVPSEDLTLPQKLATHLVRDGLLLHFHVGEAGFAVNDQTACLTMHFADGRLFRGCGAVAIRR